LSSQPITNPPPIPNIAPWLAVRDAQQAVAFYAAAFGATELYRLDGDNGRIEVAQLSIGGATLWVQHDPSASPEAHVGRASSEVAVRLPETPAVTRVRLILSVDDPDKFFAQSVAAGAIPMAVVHEEYGWRTGRISDPFGHDWELSKQLPA
jgi:PhnB protein